MKNYLPDFLRIIGLTSLMLFPIGVVLSAEEPGVREVKPETGTLASLVRQYLEADSNNQGELIEIILSRPDANLQEIANIIQAGYVYEKMPVGMLPSQRILVKGQPYEYGLYVPPSYDPSSSFALIICLHGAGFSGDSYLERWVPRLKSGYILACPTISMGTWWTRQGEDLVLATLHSVRSRYHIDTDRIFLTGMSNGGIGAWIIGMHQAPLFAGVAPMASGIDKVLYPFLENLKQTSVYVIHGLHDQVMPVWLSRELVEEMKRRNIQNVYREHRMRHPHAGGHFFPREELPGLITWFDQQSRNPLPKILTVVRDATHLQNFLWVRIDATERIAAFTDNLIDSQDEFIEKGIFANLQAEIPKANHIVVKTHLVRRFSLFLNNQLVDLSVPVTVETNGKVSYHAKVYPNRRTLLRQARHRMDPRMLFPVHLVIAVEP